MSSRQHISTTQSPSLSPEAEDEARAKKRRLRRYGFFFLVWLLVGVGLFWYTYENSHNMPENDDGRDKPRQPWSFVQNDEG